MRASGKTEREKSRGRDDGSREEIGERKRNKGEEKGKKAHIDAELKQIIYLSGINGEAYRMERI